VQVHHLYWANDYRANDPSSAWSRRKLQPRTPDKTRHFGACLPPDQRSVSSSGLLLVLAVDVLAFQPMALGE